MLGVVLAVWKAIPGWLKVALISAVIIAGMWGVIKWYQYQKSSLETQISDLKNDLQNKQVQLDAFSSQLNAEIEKQKQIQEQLVLLNDLYNQHRDAIVNLQSKFSKHDLNKLSTKKPGLIENIINDASSKAIDDLNNLGDLK